MNCNWTISDGWCSPLECCENIPHCIESICSDPKLFMGSNIPKFGIDEASCCFEPNSCDRHCRDGGLVRNANTTKTCSEEAENQATNTTEICETKCCRCDQYVCETYMGINKGNILCEDSLCDRYQCCSAIESDEFVQCSDVFLVASSSMSFVFIILLLISCWQMNSWAIGDDKKITRVGKGIPGQLFGGFLMCNYRIFLPNYGQLNRQEKGCPLHKWFKTFELFHKLSFTLQFVDIASDVMFARSVIGKSKCMALISLTSTSFATLILFISYRSDFYSWKYGVPHEIRKLLRIRFGILLLFPIEDIVQIATAVLYFYKESKRDDNMTVFWSFCSILFSSAMCINSLMTIFLAKSGAFRKQRRATTDYVEGVALTPVNSAKRQFTGEYSTGDIKYLSSPENSSLATQLDCASNLTRENVERINITSCTYSR